MPVDLFVNEAIDYAFTMFTRSKGREFSSLYNSFLVVVVRALCEIYGELDITNPFLTGNEYGFNLNLKKFGYSEENLVKFRDHMQSYYEWAKKASKNKIVNKSTDFVAIQKDLIDMMECKLGEDTEEIEKKIKEFKQFLYTDENSNPKFKLFNIQVADDMNAVKKYLNEMIAKKKAQVEVLNIKDISAPGDEKDEIYKMIEADMANEPARRYANMLKLKPNLQPRLALSSGNGFVDLMVLISVVTTLGAVAFIVAILTGI